jgi:hypothetical protein
MNFESKFRYSKPAMKNIFIKKGQLGIAGKCHWVLVLILCLTLWLPASASAADTSAISELEAENDLLRKKNEELASELLKLKALYAVVIEKLAKIEDATPTEDDTKRTLEARISEQSKGRIRLTQFKKRDGVLNPLGGYLVEYEAETEVLEACYWGPLNIGLWHGEFYTAVGNPNDLQYLSPEYLGKVKARRGERISFHGVVNMVKTEKGWGMRMVEQRLGAAPPSARENANSKPHQPEVATAAPVKASVTEDPTKPVADVKIVNNTSGKIDLLWDGSETFEPLPSGRSMTKKLEVGSRHEIKVVGSRGWFKRSLAVSEEGVELQISPDDFKRSSKKTN